MMSICRAKGVGYGTMKLKNEQREAAPKVLTEKKLY